MKTAIGIIIIFIFILFGVSVIYLTTYQHKPSGWFVSHDDVRGIDVVSDDLPYTLNFAQQGSLIHILNSGKKVKDSSFSSTPPPRVSKITIYLFSGKPDLILLPETEDFSRFSVSLWDSNSYLDIIQPKQLEELLKTAYDTP